MVRAAPTHGGGGPVGATLVVALYILLSVLRTERPCRVMGPRIVKMLQKLGPVEAKVRAALERAGYTGVDALLVVAVSGGPDSMSLLHALLRLKESAGLRLHVAHLDHDFRGEEAKEDARFVSRAAGELGLPATVEEADPVAYQKQDGAFLF